MNRTAFASPSTRLAAAALLATCTLACTSAHAAKSAVRGPMRDLQVTFPVDYVNGPCAPVDYPTYHYPYPPFTNTWPNISDHEWVTCNPTHVIDVAARAVGYVTAPKGDFTKGQLGLVTIFGIDLDPQGTDPLITGVNPADPEFDVQDETWSGISKTIYKSTRQAVPIGELAALLGPQFDLTPFAKGDPNSLVYVFTGSMPAKNMGERTTGTLYSETFAQTWHVGQEPGGSFGPGTLPGTNLTVTQGTVDVLGALNGGTTACTGNPSGDCLDLWGQGGPGAVSTIPVFDLDPALTYELDFVAWSQGPSGYGNLGVQLGDGQWQIVTSPSPTKYHYCYRPTAFTPGVPLSFASVQDGISSDGVVLAGIVMSIPRNCK